MQTNFKRLTKPELDFLKDNCNFSDDEKTVLEMAVVNKSDLQIAEKLKVSTATVTKIKKQIKSKMLDFLEVSRFMTTIYVNGERVTKEDLKNYEIQIEAVKRMIAEKLTGKS